MERTLNRLDATELSSKDLELLERLGQQDTELSPTLSRFMRAFRLALQDGLKVALVAEEEYLSTQEAAEVLGVSRPHIVRILESGRIEYKLVGTHRRIRCDDLTAYAVERSKRIAALDRLSTRVREEGFDQ